MPLFSVWFAYVVPAGVGFYWICSSFFSLVQTIGLNLYFTPKRMEVIAEKEIGGLVYGLPLQMNGEEGEIAKEVRTFAEKLAKEIDLPYIFWDERLSSSAVEKFLIKEVDMSRGKRKKILDASAAAYILQGALDALSFCR